MKILIDIGHPAHVHYYRNLANNLLRKGHNIYFTVKNIEIAKRLLSHYGFDYKVLPSKKDFMLGKIINQIKYDFILWWFCIKNKIDIAIGTSVSIAHISKISKVHSIIFDDDDDDVQPFVTKYANPFADVLLSPDALKGKRKRKDTIYFPGYMELAYLHPKQFTPDPNVLKEAGLKENEPFFILRFNAFKAHHDIGVEGLNLENKRKLINLLLDYGKVFITTEREIDPEFEQYRLPIAPEKIHSFLYYATMFIGDSQTMTSEAAVLGTPAIRSNSFVGRISYLEEQERIYGLTFGFKPDESDKMFKKIQELLSLKNLKEEWQLRRQKMLADKIDVTAFMVWFVENYPESVQIIRENPDYQFNFK